MDLPNPQETLGRIQELIDSSFTSKYAFSKQSGIDTGNLSKKLKGDLTITMNDVDRICKNVHVSKDWLLYGTGDKFTKQPDENSTGFIKNRIIDLARRLAENKEEITRMERENSDILAQLSVLCSQLGNA